MSYAPPDTIAARDFVFVDRDDELAGAHADIRAFWAYRKRCVGASGFPSRRLFDPTEISRLLSRIWILDIDPAGGDFRYRLVGTRVVQAIGFDPTGQSLGAAMAERLAANPWLRARFDETLASGRATWRRGSARHWARMEYRHVENLMIPFVCGRDRFEQLVCISVYD